MKKKLDCILLVDDDEATNYFNEMVIELQGCAEKVIAVENGLEALEFLTKKTSDGYLKPDLIFLDINMPRMNGWEFMQEYNKLSKDQQAKIILVMLTTSLNPSDMKRAEENHQIKGFVNKPLKAKELEVIIQKHFKDQI